MLLQDGVLIGEVGIAAVDRGTSTAEYSAWVIVEQVGSGGVRRAGVLAALAAFTGPRPLQRLVVAASVANPAANGAARSAGFNDKGVLNAYRLTSSGREDRRVWTLKSRRRHAAGPARGANGGLSAAAPGGHPCGVALSTSSPVPLSVVRYSAPSGPWRTERNRPWVPSSAAGTT